MRVGTSLTGPEVTYFRSASVSKSNCN